MELSVSILGIKEDTNKKIKELNKLNVDYLHIDVMDGKFVPNKNNDFNKLQNDLDGNKKELDVHLMVEDAKEYIKKYKTLNPKYITFHYEGNDNIDSIINEIKVNNIGVGISIKPSTDVALLIPYLEKIDLVLIMTVEPGFGGQKFMENMDYKIKDLIHLRNKNNYKFKIEVDGGINAETIEKVNDVDIVVVGSYITSSNDYKGKIKNIIGE